jgi:translation initiation factor IF-1
MRKGEAKMRHTYRKLYATAFAVSWLLFALTMGAVELQGGKGTKLELIKIYCQAKKDSSIKLMLRKEPIEVIAKGQAVLEWSQGKIWSEMITARLLRKEVKAKETLGTVVDAEAVGNVRLEMDLETEEGQKAHVTGSCKRLQIDPKESLLIMTGSPQITVRGISPEISQALGKAGKIVMWLETGELLFEPGDEDVFPEVNVQVERKPATKEGAEKK